MVSKNRRIAGWVVSVLPCLLLGVSAAMKFAKPPEATQGNSHLGWSNHLMTPLGVVEVVCTVLYLIPMTSTLGAILLTGYLGGAVATHVRVGDPFVIPVVLGVVLWLGLLLREPKLGGLLPLRR